MPQTRETFIALRATRTAHRVASDVAYPEMEVVQPQPALPLEDEFEDGEPRVVHIVNHEFSARDLLVFLAVFAVMVALVVLIVRS